MHREVRGNSTQSTVADSTALRLVPKYFVPRCNLSEREGITRPGHEAALGEGRDRGRTREEGRKAGRAVGGR